MHKTIWFKIHWFLGITAGIVLMVVGFSGAMLSFEKEILKAINQDSYYVNVPANQEKLTAKELLEKFQMKMPEAKINGISYLSDPEASFVITIAGEGENAKRGINKFINPYTGEILPDIVGKEFFSFNLRLHRWLALSGDAREVGKQTVAISTISLVILIISAIVIYWGRIKNSFFKSFTFKFRHKGRAFLSTMHSAIGMWVIPFYLLASLTGLFWSYDWFNSALYTIAGVEKPQRMQPPQEQQGQGKQQGEMAQGQRGEGKPQGDMAQGQKGEGKPEGERAQREGKPQGENSTTVKFNNLQNAINMFNVFVQRDYSSYTVRFPQKGSVYSFSYLDTNPEHFRATNTLELDINSWQLLKHDIYTEKPLNERLMKSILPLHTGEYFGIIGQTGMFIASLLMSLFTITGFMLYFNRKNKKKEKEKEKEIKE